MAAFELLWSSAADPLQTFARLGEDHLYLQIAIIVLASFVAFMGLIEANPLTGGPAALIVVLASYALYKNIVQGRNSIR